MKMCLSNSLDALIAIENLKKTNEDDFLSALPAPVLSWSSYRTRHTRIWALANRRLLKKTEFYFIIFCLVI